MEQEKDRQIKAPAPIESAQDAELAPQPPGSSQPDPPPKSKRGYGTAIYNKDAWEALPVGRKIAGISFAIFVLFLIVFYGPRDLAMIILTAAIALVGLNQYYIYKRQAHVMQEQRQAMIDGLAQNKKLLRATRQQTKIANKALRHAKDALEVIESPLILITSVLKVDAWYPKIVPQISIENAGRTTAHNIRLQFGVAHAPLGEKLDKYPGHASKVYWYGFLASQMGEEVEYQEADTGRVENLSHPPGHPLGGEYFIYGSGTYEGMGKEYVLPIFVFRAERIPTTEGGFVSRWVRDDRLARKWEEEADNQDAEDAAALSESLANLRELRSKSTAHAQTEDENPN